MPAFPLRAGQPVVSIDGVRVGSVEGSPFQGPGGAAFFALRVPDGRRLVVPLAAMVGVQPDQVSISVPARHLDDLPACEPGALDPETARRAFEAVGARQGFDFEAVTSLTPQEPLDSTERLAGESGLPSDRFP